MYTSNQNRNENIEEIRDFIKSNSFGILVNIFDGKPWATHIPILLETNDSGQDILVGHIARANPQWQNFTENPDVLAIFTAHHAYISSSWYNHENVPTWNYIAVHCYGKIRIIEGDALYQSLKKLMDKYEAYSENPMRLETMTEKLVQAQMRGILGFEILIEEMQANYKLSQNRKDEDYQNVIQELQKRGDENSIKIAHEMSKHRNLNT
ncbi:MAG: FMN-binding negative transcriptional regulator [Saprospiraceae bacterium]|nr:FMN-binding negative transcriptional regulator [Saprospiraceae bacterium]